LDDVKIVRPSSEQIAHQQHLSEIVDGECIAYIMFTSGSTGEPKGVAVTHQNVLHFIEWGKRRFGVDSGSNFANLSPMYFDNSVFDFFVCFFSGGVITPVRRELLTDPYSLVKYIDQMGCNIWFSVPSLLIYLTTMKAMKGVVLPKLRTIIFGGEGYPKTELKKLYDEFSRQSTLVNVYGPTECTCICSAYDIAAKDFEDLEGLPPLGKLNPNFDYRVVDESNRDSSVGELHLIGPNVAAGYFNDDERTSKAFSVLKSPERFMKRMYRTGDLVRDDGGCLYFVGRKDNQIKHMGYRIELEEIENALNGMADIKQAAVVYHRVHTTHGKIIAFVAVSGNLITEIDIKNRLAVLLPDYMIPSSIMIWDELPKNANGKVDRVLLLSGAQVS
jgi:D-alanine--poly(phosphoribitol) ligase subunit 1